TIRLHLIQLAQVKSSMEGRDEKMNMLYQYLSGAQFKNRVESMVMAFTEMREDLEKERKFMELKWSKREMSIKRFVLNTTGMYGDLQGIIGASLTSIDSLELDDGDPQLSFE